MNKKALLSTVLVVIAAAAGGFLISEKSAKITNNLDIEPEIEAQIVISEPKIEVEPETKNLIQTHQEQPEPETTDAIAEPIESPEKIVNLDEIVEQLDEIAEQVELLTVQVQEFVAARNSQKNAVILAQKTVKGAKVEPESPEDNIILAKETLETEIAEPENSENDINEGATEPSEPPEIPEQTPEPPTQSYTIFVPPPPPPKLLISEIQVENASSTNDEFVELYNPNQNSVSLSGWSLQKATDNGSVSKKNFETGASIPSKGYFLIVNKHASEDLLSLADMSHNSFGITANNTIFLAANQKKITSGDEAAIIDKVGYGEPFSPEAESAPSPGDGHVIGRKWTTTTQEYLDTDNNYDDFEIQIPTPKAQNQTLKNTVAENNTTSTATTTVIATTTETTTATSTEQTATSTEETATTTTETSTSTATTTVETATTTP